MQALVAVRIRPPSRDVIEAFRDWAAETTAFPSEVAEMALAHVVADATEAAYRRGDLFAKRRGLMDAWAAFLTGTAAADNVVSFEAARA